MSTYEKYSGSIRPHKLKYLLSIGCPVNAGKASPIYLAIFGTLGTNLKQIIKLLIDAGASTDNLDDICECKSAFHFAVDKRLEILQLLKKFGCRLDIANP